MNENININLIIINNNLNQKDLGLYAMNYNTSYVASTAIYQSYQQTIRSIIEANLFNGPSILLGYLPIDNLLQLNHIKLIQQSKRVVDSGDWPLYRYNPNNSNMELDSKVIKQNLQQFIDKQQLFSLLTKQNNTNINNNNNNQVDNLINSQQKKEEFIQNSFNSLLNNLTNNDEPPITILYGSDGGNAEKVAKKLSQSIKQRNKNVQLFKGNDYDIQQLNKEHLMLFIISTAGQGEAPLNIKHFIKSINQKDIDLSHLKIGIFGLGDSHYWPNDKDLIYFNKPSKDLNLRLQQLNATSIIELGLGDDQDPEGYQTQYKLWEHQLFIKLNIDDIKVDDEVIITDDLHKINSNYLRGTILQGLNDSSTGALSEGDTKLTKFHGIYQQDDRDLREIRLSNNLEPAFSFMVRVRVPGGIATAEQYLQMDDISTKLTNGSIKITTRQAFQFHGVIKKNLKPTIQNINKCLMDTLAACGDVNRNVMLTVNPQANHAYETIFKFSKDLSEYLSPKTSAYHEIWLQDKLVAGGDVLVDYEPLYGPTYLPRKFKIAIAIPPNNDVDVFAHCLGFIAIIKNNQLIGFNVTVGGGMGMTHNNTTTFPRLADHLGFCTLEQACEVAEKVLLVQRDFGDRTNRKHARLKYTIEDRGINWFRNEVEDRLGYKLETIKEYSFKSNGDRYGWYQNEGSLNYECGLFMQNGRIKDESGYTWKTGLREVCLLMKQYNFGRLILTPNQNLVLSNIPPKYQKQIESILTENNLYQTPNFTKLRLNSMACVALPTCSLAMAESERYLPSLIDKLDNLIHDNGLSLQDISIRMTGCPNGCARPYVAEIALVGKAANIYNLYLGGGYRGDRLNKLFKENVDEKEIINILSRLFKRYALERLVEERFGDFVIRTNIIKETTSGNNFHVL
ncbi:sulfite reductase [NADPH] beta subunit [Neoconidiobolus thromboides FSU 785]|nr:sulfite reductase [NADPH] beta subunit [Neoconidiobolus thromboides FSU 785]